MSKTQTPLYQIEMMSVRSIKPNPDNPRKITEARFEELKKNITNDPWYMSIRPVVVNEKKMVVGGNQRLAACKSLKIKTVPVIQASDLSKEDLKKFIIYDNIDYGTWDWGLLEGGWKKTELIELGLTEWPSPTKLAIGQEGGSQFEFKPNFEPDASGRQVTTEDIEKMRERMEDTSGTERTMIDVICPSCANEFSILKNQ